MKKIIVALFIVFTFMACQKEYAPDVRINNAPDSTILLKKLAIIDITSPSDTEEIFTYSYDNRNRCIKAEYLDVMANESSITLFTFNGTDSLVKSSETYQENDTVRIFEYFSYNAAGKMIKDSVIIKNVITGTVNSTFVYDYNFAGNLVQGMIYQNGAALYRTVHSQQYDAQGNIINENDSNYVYAGNPPAESLDFVSVYNNTYDTKNNPLYKIYPRYNTIWMNANPGLDDLPFFFTSISKNNITSQTRTDDVTYPNGSQSYNDLFTYTYNNNNYPSVIVYQDAQNGGVYKGFYFY